MKTGLVAGAMALLAACGGNEAADEPVAGGGEVLEGTASDAMLPLATVTSQPPLAPPEPDTSARAPAGRPAVQASAAPGAMPSAGPSAVPTTASSGAATD
ncbi:hypothetical protein PK98_10190 [Croceibacterium mercuriale]|uniref:Argininosuccinate lyase n=1 Tax=Croceibacterium mercuriale TaxID=1572751 RepID=A0A0B2BSL1_9SPHN|nr:hypothetical protein PK98_10190 [Croceibacterium mercuriale]